MKNFNYLFLALLATAITFLGCKKVQDCTPGEKQYLNNPTEMQKSSKADPCELERIAVQVADSLLNQVYGPDVRPLAYIIMNELGTVSSMYKGKFNGWLQGAAFLDSVSAHVLTVDEFWTLYGNPLPQHNDIFTALYDKCGIYVEGDSILKAKNKDLTDCENGVPVIEIKPTYICDDNGNWINLITGKKRGDQ